MYILVSYRSISRNGIFVFAPINQVVKIEGDIVIIMLVTNIEKEKKKEEEKRILLVDDEQDLLLTFQLILEHEGFKVYPFDNPLHALSSFKSELYDLAILDIKMPKMDGFQLYEEIKKIDSSVKVCFITAAGAAATGEQIYQYQEITEKNRESVGEKAKQKQQQQQPYCELQKTMFLKNPISNGVVREVNRIINVNKKANPKRIKLSNLIIYCYKRKN